MIKQIKSSTLIWCNRYECRPTTVIRAINPYCFYINHTKTTDGSMLMAEDGIALRMLIHRRWGYRKLVWDGRMDVEWWWPLGTVICLICLAITVDRCTTYCIGIGTNRHQEATSVQPDRKKNWVCYVRRLRTQFKILFLFGWKSFANATKSISIGDDLEIVSCRTHFYLYAI